MNQVIKIPRALTEIKKSKMLIIVDHPQRENEGDFFIPAQLVTSNAVNLMLRLGRGLVCAAITGQQAARLELPLMIPPKENNESTKVNFAISVNASAGISSGISSADRSATIKILADEKAAANSLTRPGHVFPLIAAEGGLAERGGHTEAAVTLAALAGFGPAGVLCEILDDDGEVARMPSLVNLAERLQIGIVTIADLKQYLDQTKAKTDYFYPTVSKTAETKLTTKYGIFQMTVYKSLLDGKEHVALRWGKGNPESMLTRIHSQCLTGDTLFSFQCDCGEQLRQSLKTISGSNSGVLVYLNQEGRGIGLSAKIKAYNLQDKGLDTVSANEALGFEDDPRDYRIAAEILKDLGITKIQLLTNNPKKTSGLTSYGIRVTNQIPLEIQPNQINQKYLEVKKHKLGHRLSLV